VHDVPDGHDTELSSDTPPAPVLGLGAIDHAVPSQDSTRVTVVPAMVPALPTAVQAVAEVHDTSTRGWSWPGSVSGLGTIDQAVPFHCSTRVWSASPVSADPTATHQVTEVQVTP
jgi:hypothetical protein